MEQYPRPKKARCGPDVRVGLKTCYKNVLHLFINTSPSSPQKSANKMKKKQNVFSAELPSQKRRNIEFFFSPSQKYVFPFSPQNSSMDNIPQILPYESGTTSPKMRLPSIARSQEPFLCRRTR